MDFDFQGGYGKLTLWGVLHKGLGLITVRMAWISTDLVGIYFHRKWTISLTNFFVKHSKTSFFCEIDFSSVKVTLFLSCLLFVMVTKAKKRLSDERRLLRQNTPFLAFSVIF